MVGAQYWSFKYHKGPGKISIRFASMGLFGNPTTATMQIALRTAAGKAIATNTITSRGPAASLDMPGNFLGPGAAVLELSSNGTCLVRAGGDYSITLSGDGIDLAAAGPAGGPDRTVGTYAVMVCAPDFDCQGSLAIHFAPGRYRANHGRPQRNLEDLRSRRHDLFGGDGG
jgi:hypothetical protein